MRAPDKLTTYLLELLAPLGPTSARRMFGGVGLFHGGTMFGLIAREELFFKVGDANRPAYEAAGEAPFTYDTKLGTHTLGSFGAVHPNCWTMPRRSRLGRARRSRPLLPRRAPNRKRPASEVPLPRLLVYQPRHSVDRIAHCTDDHHSPRARTFSRSTPSCCIPNFVMIRRDAAFSTRHWA